MGVLDTVTTHLSEMNFEALPSVLIEVTKKQILDTLAATVGGSTCDVSGELSGLVELIKEWGGKEESSIVAFGGKVPAANAAFLNGTLAVRLDFDDTHADMVHNHVSRAVVPTAFAVAERRGNVNGKELITAVALGYDLSARMKQAVGRDADSAFGMTTNFFGATATAGKILGHTSEELKTALGLALNQISGAGAYARSNLKGLSNGFAAKGGVLSALFADKGFSSSMDFMEPVAKNNFYDQFYHGYYWPWLITQDLGKVFAGTSASQKEFPCCHGQHAAIKAALGLIREHAISPEDVASVELRLSPMDYSLLGTPLERKQDPQNIIETQFSLCWGVAGAIVYGEVGIGNFGEEALRDTRVREMARKVFPRSEVELGGHGFTPAIVKILTNDGAAYSRRVEFPFGSPRNPMSFADVAAKFRHCCQYSVRPIPHENQDKVINMARDLEEVGDVGAIMRLLC